MKVEAGWRENAEEKLIKVCWGLPCLLRKTFLRPGTDSGACISKTAYFKEVILMSKYVCELCDYVYDPAIGDPDNNIPPGTPFADLPDDWLCPVCGAEKSEFQEEK